MLWDIGTILVKSFEKVLCVSDNNGLLKLELHFLPAESDVDLEMELISARFPELEELLKLLLSLGDEKVLEQGSSDKTFWKYKLLVQSNL